MSALSCPGCGRKNDYEYETCRNCAKKPCTLDGMPQPDGNYGNKK